MGGDEGGCGCGVGRWGCVQILLLFIFDGCGLELFFVSVSCLLFGTTSIGVVRAFLGVFLGGRELGACRRDLACYSGYYFGRSEPDLFHIFIQSIRNLRSAVVLASSVLPIPLALAIIFPWDLFLKKRNI